MKLALMIEVDDNGNCVDDPRLSRGKWVIGTVAIVIAPCQFYQGGNYYVTDDPPELTIHGSSSFPFAELNAPKFMLADFERAMSEARAHAVKMREAIGEHIRRLCQETLR